MQNLLAAIRAGRKPVIGMVQLDALATGAQYRGGGLPPVLDAALAEARILYENGIGALMVQNLGDIPVALEATREQVAWMTRIASDIRAAFNLPVGLNMLENDAAATMAVASASGADFVRIKIYVGAMMTPFGLETAKAHEAIKARNALGADNVAIFADVHDRTGTPLASGGFIEDVDYYGAKMANPKVKVLETYTGSFTDPSGGKEYTLANVNKGADINFAVAGPTSVGVIEGAKDTKTLAIGVDSDMNCYAKGSVLTSMVKRVDTQTYDMVKSVGDGSFKGGVVKFYGLAEDGVEAAMDDCNKGLISDAVLKEVDGLKAKLLSGEIVVPNYFDLKPGQKEMGKPAIATPPSLANATSLAQ